VVPPVGGGSISWRGRRPEGGRRLLRGPKHRGANEPPPISLWTMKRMAPLERALSPWVPRRGKGRRAADPKRPHSRWCQRVRPSPAQRPGRRQEARLRRRGPRPPSKPLRQLLGGWRLTRRPSVLRVAFKEPQDPRRVLPPRLGTY